MALALFSLGVARGTVFLAVLVALTCCLLSFWVLSHECLGMFFIRVISKTERRLSGPPGGRSPAVWHSSSSPGEADAEARASRAAAAAAAMLLAS